MNDIPQFAGNVWEVVKPAISPALAEAAPAPTLLGGAGDFLSRNKFWLLGGLALFAGWYFLKKKGR